MSTTVLRVVTIVGALAALAFIASLIKPQEPERSLPRQPKVPRPETEPETEAPAAEASTGRSPYSRPGPEAL